MHHTRAGAADGAGGGGEDIVEAGAEAPPPQRERLVPHSGPLSKRSGMRKSARFAESVSAPLSAPSGWRRRARAAAANDDDEEDYVEITLDVRDDSVAVHSVKPAGGGGEDSDVTLLARTLEKRSSSFGHSVIRNASSRIKQVSQELRRLASVNRRGGGGGAGGPRFDRSKSAAAHALKGLKFISRADGGAGWPAVEKRFDDLAKDGLLPRSKFGQCIGTISNTFSIVVVFFLSSTNQSLSLAGFRDEGAGVRRRAVRRAGEAAEHLRRQHQQGGAAGILGPNLRHQLRQPSPNLLRHVSI